MSFQLMQDCNDMSCDMSSTEHAVLMVLCRYADDDGNNCFPSTAEIARCSHFAVLPVRKAIAGLEASGWIKSQQESGKKRFFTVDVAKIRGALPLTNQHVGIDQHPRIDQYGGIDQHPRIDQHPDPVSINTGTPYRSIPRKEHIKEQEKDREDSCALPGLGEACPNNLRGVTPKIGVTGNPNNWGGNKKENKKEEKDTPAAACASLISTAEGRAETVPTPQEPFSLKAEKPKEKRKTGEIDRPGNIPEQDWADWKLARKSRRAGPITQTAWNLLVKEAAKAGITPAQAVELCAGRSWISFQAKYLREEDKPQKSQFEVSADRLADIDNRFSVKAVR